jgi:hypothetical protein
VVKISRDCGKTWMVRRTYNPDQLPTVAGTMAGTFNPAPEDWAQTTNIAIPPSFATDNLLVRFEFTSGGGHDLFIDDINLDDQNVIGIAERERGAVLLAPNPADQVVVIATATPMGGTQVVDIQGRTVHQRSETGDRTSIDTRALAPGTYLVIITLASGRQVRERLVVAH